MKPPECNERSQPSAAPHARSLATVLADLQTDVERGLTSAEARARNRRHGENRLAQTLSAPWWRKLLAQLNQLVIYILLAAALFSLALGEWLESGAILAIVVLNALLGFFQERKAENALASLKQLSAPVARVLREGTWSGIAARELTPGDIVELQAGDRVPADLRLISAFEMKLDEAALTGESVAVEKSASAAPALQAGIAERANMLFMGTSVVAGHGRAVVAAIGMNTELGRIAGFLGGEEHETTPLQKRLEELGRVLIAACLALVALIFALQLLRGQGPAETVLTAISLAVAAVPEGLPAVVTISLALGLGRLVRRNALIRRLASVETLGSVTYICSDKTGTLTRNEMMVSEIHTTAHNYRLSGAGYAPAGEFFGGDTEYSDGEYSDGDKVEPRALPDLMAALEIGLWCSNAQLQPPTIEGEPWRILGDPTEGALVVAAAKAGLAQDGERVLVHELPFDSERKLMSVALCDARQQISLFTKGAPEALLGRCAFELRNGETLPLTDERREQFLQRSREMAARALRVLALARREVGAGDYAERDLVFVGLVGMMDPPRDEARAAVAKCRSAGIRPVMITGDHPATALAIARALGIAGQDDAAMTGAELDTLPDLEEHVERIAVYARVSPEHKLRVVRALQARGQVVAMTGDGVNDAPAVKKADIGIAMGMTGTDVTREASDMVLTDDNFASIVSAVEEGRGIFDNIQKFVHFLLAGNSSEIGLVLFAALLGWPAPLLPIQILWINLVTDGLPALALALEKPEPDVMRRPPRPPQHPFFTPQHAARLLAHGGLIAAFAIGGFALASTHQSTPQSQATAFYIIAFAQLFFSLACRSRNYTLPQLGFFSNPYLSVIIALSVVLQLSLLWFPLTRDIFFKGAFVPDANWLWIFALALLPVSLVEIAKIIRRRFTPAKATSAPVATGIAKSAT